jgi:uncharacterized protein YndB with AHSA1/START domain
MAATTQQTKEVVFERIIDAPREKVWRAWTDPEWLMRWWGPANYTSPLARMDVQPGGHYLWAMRGPDGKDNYSTGVFREVVPPERLVYTDSFGDEHGNVVSPTVYGLGDDFPEEMLVTVTLHDLGDGRTLMRTVTANMPTGDIAEMATLGWNQSLDKLAAFLDNTMHLHIDRDNLQTTIRRTFDAPRELVWRAISEKALLERWWGLPDNPVTIDQLDFRPGGAWRFVERDKEGNEYGFRGEYREIERPSRVVQTFEFEPMAGHIIVETMTLEERDGRTTVTAVSQYANLEDLEGMVQSGMEAGSEATYNRLEALLRTL